MAESQEKKTNTTGYCTIIRVSMFQWADYWLGGSRHEGTKEYKCPEHTSYSFIRDFHVDATAEVLLSEV